MSDVSVLDRQVWNMLHGEFAHLAVGTEHAKRIDPAYGPFAAARSAGDRDQGALRDLLTGQDDQLWLVEPEIWPAPQGTKVVRSAELLQLVAENQGASESVTDADIIPLGDGDAPEMMTLAHATEPGPWESRTHLYGQFYGIRIDGKLSAMAGERMQPSPEFSEVSGVCTYPEYRGRGLARRLIKRVMASQRERGLTPYLHSYASNDAAIGLYKSLGFEPRRNMFVTILALA